jgi:hypothetical protein
MLVKFRNTICCSSPFIGELRCQAIQTEHGPCIPVAERTQKAVYIVRCLCINTVKFVVSSTGTTTITGTTTTGTAVPLTTTSSLTALTPAPGTYVYCRSGVHEPPSTRRYGALASNKLFDSLLLLDSQRRETWTK